MSSQNILQQLKNSHSLLPASRDTPPTPYAIAYQLSQQINRSYNNQHQRARSRCLGRLFDSSGGFILPDTNLKAPDVSFVPAARLPRSLRYFGEMVPELVVEIKSQSDRIKPLQKKLEKYIQLGAQVGILIDPDLETVTVYRPTSEPVELVSDDILTIPELFPGWEISISELWPPVFDEQ